MDYPPPVGGIQLFTYGLERNLKAMGHDVRVLNYDGRNINIYKRLKMRDFFYTAGQAAKILGVNRITIWRWTKRGKLNAQYIGREVIIPKWEVEIMKEKLKIAT